MTNKFLCIRCGMCCKNLDKNNLYSDLDRGDGICKYFNETNNLCNIYETRPDKCNVEEGYKYFKELMSLEEYLQYNVRACEKLQRGIN